MGSNVNISQAAFAPLSRQYVSVFPTARVLQNVCVSWSTFACKRGCAGALPAAKQSGDLLRCFFFFFRLPPSLFVHFFFGNIVVFRVVYLLLHASRLMEFLTLCRVIYDLFIYAVIGPEALHKGVLQENVMYTNLNILEKKIIMPRNLGGYMLLSLKKKVICRLTFEC